MIPMGVNTVKILNTHKESDREYSGFICLTTVWEYGAFVGIFVYYYSMCFVKTFQDGRYAISGVWWCVVCCLPNDDVTKKR